MLMVLSIFILFIVFFKFVFAETRHKINFQLINTLVFILYARYVHKSLIVS